MSFRILMATATAASVLMAGGAMAGDNETLLIQNGTSNTADVDQSGDGNAAGNHYLTSTTWAMKQDGSNNAIDVTQVGRYNELGADNGNRYHSVSDVTYGLPNFIDGWAFNGVLQENDKNKLVVEQRNAGGEYAGNWIGAVKQTGVVGASQLTNLLTIKQLYSGSTPGDGPRNYVGLVSQTFIGAGNTAGLENEIEIEQTDGSYANGNRIYTVKQNGSDNFLSIHQSGTKNAVRTVDQKGVANSADITQGSTNNLVALVRQDSLAAALGNSATIVLTGSNNGQTGLAGAASASGATNSSVIQLGSENIVEFTATGSYNEYGFSQDGTGNSAENVRLIGDYNNLGVHQTGTENTLELASISGNKNNVGIVQDGVQNTVNLTIGGTGNENGGYHGFSAGLPAASLGLQAGLLRQFGDHNSVQLTVTGSNNVFGTLQDNSASSAAVLLNTITGTIIGNGNEAAIKQLGNANTASLDQSGANNNSLISQ